MKKKMILLVTLCAVFLSFGLTGCMSRGHIKGQDTGVGVKLESKNYRMLKAAAQGESRGFKLLGIIPFGSPSYSKAKRDLYRSAGTQLEGKAIALVNQTEDRSTLYLILFSIPKLTLNADIIEYTE